MRNDVKLGFAIGGVLLAVLIVYVLVVPGGSNQAKKVSQAGGTTSSGQGSGLSKSGGTGGAGTVTFEPVAGANTQPAPAVPPPSYDPKIASALKDSSVKEQAKTTDPFAANATKSDEPIAKGAPAVPPVTPRGGDLDWNKLLNDQPVLMTQTPVASSGAKAQAPAEPGNQAGADTTAAPTGTVPPAGAQSTGTDSIAAVASGGPDSLSAVGSNTTPTSAEPISASPTSQPALAGSRTHVVQSGETLSSISNAAYGTSSHYPAIIKANPGIDPAHLKVGQTINLPALAAVRPTAAPSVVNSTVVDSTGAAGGGVYTPTASGSGASNVASGGTASNGSAQHASAKIAPAVDSTREYRVAPGDSLYKISVHLYGRGDRADKIYQANKQTIGDDPHRLKVGQVLSLPEPPTASASASSH